MKNRKKIIVLLGLIVTVYIIFMLIFSGNNPTDKVVPKYLMINDSLLWQKKNGQWIQLNKEPEKFYDNSFTVYYENQKRDNVILQKSNSNLYFFDKDYNQLTFEDVKGITTNLDLKFADFNIQQASDSDQTYINDVMKTVKASNKGIYKTNKITFDFDQDGSLETLYETTNFVFDVVDYEFSSFVFMVKGDKIEQIIASDKMPYDFISVLDIDNDDVYEIIMGYDIKNLSTFDTCYQLYDYINGKWKLIKKCS